jgi:hypothetical protein
LYRLAYSYLPPRLQAQLMLSLVLVLLVLLLSVVVVAVVCCLITLLRPCAYIQRYGVGSELPQSCRELTVVFGLPCPSVCSFIYLFIDFIEVSYMRNFVYRFLNFVQISVFVSKGATGNAQPSPTTSLSMQKISIPN